MKRIPVWIVVVIAVIVIAWFNRMSREGMTGMTTTPSTSYCIPTGVEINQYGGSVCCSGQAVRNCPDCRIYCQ